MYDQATNNTYATEVPRRPQRPLDRIDNAATRVMAAAAQIDGFLARFHGHPQQGVEVRSPSDTIAVSYSNAIEQLIGNIETLEARVSQLSDIG